MRTKVWNHDKIKQLTGLYPENTNSEIAALLGLTESAVSAMAFKLRLRKSEGFKRAHSSKGYFTKGHIPMNKGRRQTEYMPAETIERIKATQFKKGHIPKNHKPVGYERITRDGYVEVKTAEPNRFELKHRCVWEEHHGVIPDGHNIQFKDGNRLNLNIGNLYMISRSSQLKTENSLHARYPEELRKLIQLKGALKRQINKKSRI